MTGIHFVCRRSFLSGALAAAFALTLHQRPASSQDKANPSAPTHEGAYGLRFASEKHAIWTRARYDGLTEMLELSHKEKSSAEKERYRQMHDHEIRWMEKTFKEMVKSGELGKDEPRMRALVEDLKQSWGRGVTGIDGAYYLIEMPWIGELYSERFGTIQNLPDDGKLQPLTEFIEKVKEDLTIAERDGRAHDRVYDDFRNAIRTIADAKRVAVRQPLRQVLKDLETMKNKVESQGVSIPKADVPD